MPVIGTPVARTALPASDIPCTGATLPGNPATLSSVICSDQQVVRSPTTTRYQQSLFRRQKAVIISGGKVATVEWQLVTREGRPIDLSECVCVDEDSLDSNESIGSVASECEFALKFRMREQIAGRTSTELDVAITDATAGKVQVQLTTTQTGTPGVYYGEVAALQGEDLVFSNIFVLVIEEGQWSTSRYRGPPSIAEVRLHLRDSDPSESQLLDNLSFDDAEIAMAIRRPIEYWNEALPPVRTYTTQNFPFRYNWLEAIVGNLFLLAEETHRRNQLAYSAGGIQIDDMNKERNYGTAAQVRLQSFRTWVKHKKMSINLDDAWGEVGSPYYYN